MSSITWLESGDPGTHEKWITVIPVGGAPRLAHSSHPNYDRIVELAKAGDDSVFSLFDIASQVATHFEKLSERISVANGRIYFDSDEVHNTLTEQAVRMLEEDDPAWIGLVNFYERVMLNLNEHVQEQLYNFLDTLDFTITPSGNFIAYKGVNSTEDGYQSLWQGRAIVDGTVIEGNIPNNPGSVVEMPRSEVTFDPDVGCSVGLHVGTFDYAGSYGSYILECEIDPRDVVSVPNEHSHQKMRVCRYRILNVIDNPHRTAFYDPYQNVEDDQDYEWGEYEPEDDYDYYATN